MKKTIVLSTLVFLFLGIYFTVDSKNGDETVLHIDRNVYNSVFDFNKDVYRTYFYPAESLYFDTHSGMQDNGVDYVNYGTMASLAVTWLYDYHYHQDNDKLNGALDIMSNLKNTFQTYGYFPRPQYEQFEYGWVSSMDAPVVALAAQMAYEITGNEEWYNFRNELLVYCKKSTKEHGFILHEKDGNIWPMEYAECKTTEKDAKYVYNGSLFGVQALEMLASVCGDVELCDILDKFIVNYEKKSKEFIYNNREWLYYSLNPKIINPEPKVVIELHALESLSMIVPNCNFYLDELTIRRKLLGGLYKVYRSGEEGYFWRAAGPHSYMINIYPTLLEFCNDKGDVLYSRYMPGRELEDSWMVFPLQEDVKSVNVYAAPLKPNSDEYLYKTLLCKSDVEEVNPDSMYDVLPYSSTQQGNSIILKLSNKINFKEHFCRFALEIENDTNNEYNTRLIFNDGMHRYYTPIKPGKNLILINTLGIREVDASEKKYIDSIELRLFGKDKDVDIDNIVIKNVLFFHNSYEVYKYQTSHEYVVNFQ